MSRFYASYDECARDARAAAGGGYYVRLRRVSEYVSGAGYVWNYVPKPENQYGHDLEGELISPAMIDTARVERGDR